MLKNHKLLNFTRQLLLVWLAGMLLTVISETETVRAAGTVGNGTPGSCTEAAFNTALAGGGSISFNCGPKPVTINITGRKTISANTTIDGGGLITLDGGGKTALFQVLYQIPFTVKNITLVNARTTDRGAAIQNNQGPLTVTNCKFINNVSTTDAETYSGAIFAIGSSLTISGSTFSGNKGGDGGAIKNLQNNLSISNSVFTNNSSTNAGGAIAIDGANNGTGTISISNSSFSGNIGFGFGGAIFNNLYKNDTFSIDKSVFTANAVFARGGNSGQGGALFHIRTDPASPNPANPAVTNLTITNSTFSGNYSTGQGGGVWVGKNQEKIAANISGSTFSGNLTSVMGGGLWIITGGPTNLTNVTFANNKALSLSNGKPTGFGGALAVDGSSPYTLNNVTMAGNYAGFQGGGVWVAAASAGNVTLQNSIIANNAADNGGNNWNVKKNCNLTMSNGGNNLQFQAGNTDSPDCATGIATADPKLGALAYNRGPTQTMALLAGSAALNAGNNATCAATDQRGVSRPQSGTCDIGAFELAAVNSLTVSSPNDNGQGVAGTLSAALNQANGDPGIQTIVLNVATITVSGQLPTVPFGLIISGSSCANPTILNGASAPAANTVGLDLAGGVTLKNITLKSFKSFELKASNNGNRLICVKAKP